MSDKKKQRIFTLPFASVYPLYVQKAENKGRTKAELDEIIAWLTGYDGAQLERVIRDKVDFQTFFAEAPQMNPKTKLITGVVCGVRVEDIADPVMQKIRYLDKLIDELARGKAMASIRREQPSAQRAPAAAAKTTVNAKASQKKTKTKAKASPASRKTKLKTRAKATAKAKPRTTSRKRG